MNQFLQNWADPIAMLISLLLPFILLRRVRQKSGKTVRAAAVYFLFFGPAAIMAHMFFHLFQISYTAIENSIKGAFTYNFRFYGLLLMGVVFTYLSFQQVQESFKKCLLSQFSNARLYKIMFFIVVLSVPTIPFTPIGSLPAMACIISLIALAFVKKKNKELIVKELRKETLAVTA